MVGKTERTFKRNIFDLLEKILGQSLDYNRGTGEIKIGERLIYVAGASDERSEGKIRGLTLAGAYGDEVTLWPESFFHMMISRMSIDKAKFFGTTNTDSPFHWLKKNYIDKEGPDVKEFKFKLEDNSHLPEAYVTNLKKSYTGVWKQRFIDGLWVLAEGSIYPMWDPDKHFILIPVPDINTHQKYIVGIDYGITNPTVFQLIRFDSGHGRSPSNIYLIKEGYCDAQGMTDGMLADQFNRFMEGIRPELVYVDPSAKSFINELRMRRQWNIVEANNEVIPGIQCVSNMLEAGNLYIGNTCIYTAAEFGSYCWDQNAQLRGEDKPVKRADHCMDALRYALYSHFGMMGHKGASKVNMMSRLFG